MDRAIIVEHLVKNFEVITRGKGLVGAVASFVNPHKKIVQAVQDISFSIQEGELVGFIGPNGAGKTTTMKILSGILYPTSGFVQVSGFTPSERKNTYLKQIALVMGQKNQLWWDLPASETFELNRAIYDIPKRTYERNLNELLSLLSVDDLLSIPVRRLSLGQRMKLELIASLIHEPNVVFLDEPTIGLDVVAQEKMRNFLADYNKKHGATILLTSHNMGDVSNLCKRVIVIDSGMVVFDGNLTELVKRYAKRKYIKIFVGKEFDLKLLKGIGEVEGVRYPEITISVPRGMAAAAASELLKSFPVDDLNIEEEPIGSIVSRVFGDISEGRSKKVGRK
jgi:ABC-2 type transport system ATP-binding protein